MIVGNEDALWQREPTWNVGKLTMRYHTRLTVDGGESAEESEREIRSIAAQELRQNASVACSTRVCWIHLKSNG